MNLFYSSNPLIQQSIIPHSLECKKLPVAMRREFFSHHSLRRYEPDQVQRVYSQRLRLEGTPGTRKEDADAGGRSK